MKYVLDASAVLAVLNSEPGADVVAGRLANGIMSTINAVEVGTKLVDGGMTHEAASQAMSLLRLPLADFDGQLAAASVALRRPTEAAGLSLADRACLALALRENATAVTADRAWARVDVGCKIELIR
ncbi:MAG: PIN domain-containing protein [Hyphomicrobiales bacterium]|nr:MAG: PIN domain-containing protein [Hyphomicrobiales bacterium]